jgi:hypothetical protein
MKKQISNGEAKSPFNLFEKKKNFSGLQLITSIYGLLYLLFFIVSFIPFKEGGPVSDMVPFKPFDLEQIVVKLLFVVFIFGYYMTWKNKGVAGLIFILWWIGMWCLELFIIAPMGGRDFGDGIGMGLPLFILGILFIISWYREKGKEKTVSDTEPESKNH